MVGLFLSLFRPRNVIRCFWWIKEGLSDEGTESADPNLYKAFKRQQRINTIVAGVLAVVFFCLIIISSGNNEEGALESEYLDNVTNVVMVYAEELTTALVQNTDTKAMTDSEKEHLYSFINTQIEADQAV